MALIWELVISKAQRMLNKACMYDLNWSDYAEQLEGKLICVKITQVDCTIYAKISQEHILLSSSAAEAPDLTVTGKPLALMQLASKANPTSEIKIEGSAQLAETVQSMMKSLNIDWEGFIALYTGDTLAHGLGKIKAQMETIWQQSKKGSLEDAGEYFLYESQSAATADDVALFIDEVTSLNYAVDRIEARINLLAEKVTDNVQ